MVIAIHVLTKRFPYNLMKQFENTNNIKNVLYIINRKKQIVLFCFICTVHSIFTNAGNFIFKFM